MRQETLLLSFGSFIIDWIQVQNKDNMSFELSKVVSQILELYFFILSHFFLKIKIPLPCTSENVFVIDQEFQ